MFVGYGYTPYFVEGNEPDNMHQLMAKTLDTVLAEIKDIQHQARTNGATKRLRWPMMILRTPKGWTGPKKVDGLITKGFWRSHQVPFAEMATKLDRYRSRESATKWSSINSSAKNSIRDDHPVGSNRLTVFAHC